MSIGILHNINTKTPKTSVAFWKKIVFSNTKNNTINNCNLENGIYFIELVSALGGNRQISKIIIQK